MVITCNGWLSYVDLKMVDKISHSEIRNILLKHKVKWRKSKTVLSNKISNDPEYALKKVNIETLRYNTPSDYMLLHSQVSKFVSLFVCEILII